MGTPLTSSDENSETEGKPSASWWAVFYLVNALEAYNFMEP